MTQARNTRLRARVAFDRQAEEATVRNIMSNADGRRWAWNFLSVAQLFTDDGNLDHAVLAYQKGQKNMALRLLAPIQRLVPAAYITMVEEATRVDLTFNKDDPDDRTDDPDSE